MSNNNIKIRIELISETSNCVSNIRHTMDIVLHNFVVIGYRYHIVNGKYYHVMLAVITN
jgi:hypothetical protein